MSKIIEQEEKLEQSKENGISSKNSSRIINENQIQRQDPRPLLYDKNIFT